jgi:hypothetical protein
MVELFWQGKNELKQDRKFTYNVKFMRFRATIVAVECNTFYKFWVCVRSHTYTPCNAHEPCCHLLSAQLYNIVSHHLINGTIFRKKTLLDIKCVFWFPLQLFSETFFVLRRIERDMITNLYWLSCKIPIDFKFGFSPCCKCSTVSFG